MDFKTIDYLSKGNEKQRQAYTVLTKHNLLTTLDKYYPLLVGTIPIAIDIEKSDLDIICYCTNPQEFIDFITICFGQNQGFTIHRSALQEKESVVANFTLENFTIEIFGQNVPTHQQAGYRHMLIEHTLLKEKGETFRQQVIKLKKQGYKTEPAFAYLLDLKGDPYDELLRYEKNR